MNKILLIVIATIVILLAVFIIIYGGIGAEQDYVKLSQVRENIGCIVDGLDRWAANNNGLYPMGLKDQSMSESKRFIEYLEKPIKQSYQEGFAQIDSIITFVNDTLPSKLEHGRQIPGSINIYIYGNNKKYVVVGYGYKKQSVIRSDTEEFKKFYKAYIDMIKSSR